MPTTGVHRSTVPDALRLSSLTRSYGRGAGAVHALRGIDVTLPRGSFTALMGPSGSGKSTFLQCAAGLDRPTSGSVQLGGQELARMRERALTRLRRARIGFVFQSFNLLPTLTVEQNVLLPLRLDGRRADRRRAARALAEVGLADRARHRPGQLSGGQQQRVAIARALITEPEVIFADEPTGALDTVTATEILGLLRRSVDALGATVVMVTHDPAAAAWADRVLLLDQGRIADDLRPGDSAPDVIHPGPDLGTGPHLALHSAPEFGCDPDTGLDPATDSDAGCGERRREAAARRIAARMRALGAAGRTVTEPQGVAA